MNEYYIAGFLACKEMAEAEARRYAGYYPPHSDGRNTFVMLADWISALSPTPPAPPQGDEGHHMSPKHFGRVIDPATPATVGQPADEVLERARRWVARDATWSDFIAFTAAQPIARALLSTHDALLAERARREAAERERDEWRKTSTLATETNEMLSKRVEALERDIEQNLVPKSWLSFAERERRET